jgi:hypothetical protein
MEDVLKANGAGLVNSMASANQSVAASSAPAVSSPAAEEDPTTNKRVLALLDSAGVAYGTLTHAPTATSEEVR